MAKRRAPRKPITLSSNVIRENQQHRKDSPAFRRAWDTIDDLASLYDSLSTLYETEDHTRSREAQALRYRDQWTKARDRAQKRFDDALLALDDLRRERRWEAETKAGLNSPLSEPAAQEIRAALRALSPAQRDKAIREAALSGDWAVVNAVRNTPSQLLVGPYTAPLGELVTTMIHVADPELVELEQDIDTATQIVGGAAKQFRTLSASMRDLEAEQRGEQEQAAREAAEKRLAPES